MSAREFIEKLYGELPHLFENEDELRELWGQPETRKKLLEGLTEKGFGEEQLTEARKMIDAENSDIFDVLAYIAFTLPPISREERVKEHRKKIFTGYEEKLQAFLEFVLGEDVKEGVEELDPAKLPSLLDLRYGNTYEATEHLGSIPMIRETFVGFQKSLYAQLPNEGY